MGTSLGKNYVKTKRKLHKTRSSPPIQPSSSVPSSPAAVIPDSPHLPKANSDVTTRSCSCSLPELYSSSLLPSPSPPTSSSATATSQASSVGYDSYILPSPRSPVIKKDINGLALSFTLNHNNNNSNTPRSSSSSPRQPHSPRSYSPSPRKRAPSPHPSPGRFTPSSQFPSLPLVDFTSIRNSAQANIDQDSDDVVSFRSSSSSYTRTTDSPVDFASLGYSDPISRNRPRGRSISDSMLHFSIDNMRDVSISEIAKAKEREKKKNRRFEEMTKIISEKNVIIDVLDLNFVGGKIGEGAFSEVWEGYWHGIHVAVKKLKTMSDDGMFEERFLREVESLRKSNHQNVVMFFGVCLKPPCIVTEYMAGGNLYDLLHKSGVKLSSAEVTKMACDLAVGLHHLHSLSILHRDLTSLNILLDEMGNVKISDFGLSREKHQEGSMTMTLGGICNPRWRPPEITKNLGHYSEKMDVYCFSLVVWEMLTGEIPFADLDGSQAAAQVAYTGLRPKIPTTCPEPLRDLMTQCWVDDPNERPEFAYIVDVLKKMQWNAQANSSSDMTTLNKHTHTHTHTHTSSSEDPI
eukprot:TRINITY_DN1875_c0_g2_i3.p1 TRINITY_DN1875_c0_g2~~TRINITY_DN1875_c0_g2_i3.p1  ORF type:complete len:576 (-),score=111.52 TRINITY_DN1875_c0_g2_i3:105-1832(-)